MLESKEQVGTTKLTYHTIKKRKLKDIKYKPIDKQIAFIIGLFSCLEKDTNDAKYSKKLNKLITKELTCQSDLSECMKNEWETRAKVEIDYSNMQDLFPNIKKEKELELNFYDPDDFLQEQLAEVIDISERSSGNNDEKGLSHVNNAMKILTKLEGFIEKNYLKISKKLNQHEGNNNILEIIKFLLSSELGSDFMASIENDLGIRLKDLKI
ncbi:hypothetical protein MHK_006556 [Candidatus Magnetomorum sp. HK-1]|nr:hypothetical protein MHK_006556 [Candidatus Magnetomorum sp. HK-1]